MYANLIYPRNSGDIAFNATAAMRFGYGIEYVRADEVASTGPAMTVPLAVLLRFIPLSNFLLSLYCFCYNSLLLLVIIWLSSLLFRRLQRTMWFAAGLLL